MIGVLPESNCAGTSEVSDVDLAEIEVVAVGSALTSGEVGVKTSASSV